MPTPSSPRKTVPNFYFATHRDMRWGFGLGIVYQYGTNPTEFRIGGHRTIERNSPALADLTATRTVLLENAEFLPAVIWTNSPYIYHGIRNLAVWQSNGWTTKKNTAVKFVELWQDLIHLGALRVKWQLVGPGDQVPGMEAACKLARQSAGVQP